MRAGLAILMVIPTAYLIASPAHACRLHSIWNYPFPQRCPVAHHRVITALAPREPRPHRPVTFTGEEVWITLPGLTELPRYDWSFSAADEATAGRLMLRARLVQ